MRSSRRLARKATVRAPLLGPALLLFLGLLPATALAQTVTFAPPERPAVTVRTLEAEGRVHLSVADVVSPLGGEVGYDEETRSFDVKLKGHAAFFGTETSVVVVDTRLVTLQNAVRAEGSAPFADLEFFQKVIGPLVGFAFALDPRAKTLSALRAEAAEIAVEAVVADFEATTKVILRFAQAPGYKVEKGEGQLVLRFPGVKLVTSQADRTLEDPRVSRLLIRGSEAAIFLRDKSLSTNVYALTGPPRLVVDVARGSTPPPPTARSGEAPSRPGEPTPVALASPPVEPRTVVLDPGHGGTEDGARGPGGLLEKEATLLLARSVREALTRRGYRVVLTRDSDASVSLEDRAASANSAKADVFISLHANASRSASAHGTEVYYLSLDATDRAAAALAEMENRLQATPAVPATATPSVNAPAPTPTPSAELNQALREVDFILWDLAQNQHLAASEKLAEIIQDDFNRLLGIATRGVKQAPFRVLIGVNAPAVLVEAAFITNPEEEKKLGSEEFRLQAAETLVQSLETFFRAPRSPR